MAQITFHAQKSVFKSMLAGFFLSHLRILIRFKVWVPLLPLRMEQGLVLNNFKAFPCCHKNKNKRNLALCAPFSLYNVFSVNTVRLNGKISEFVTIEQGFGDTCKNAVSVITKVIYPLFFRLF